MIPNRPTYDFISLGEIVIDLISTDLSSSLADTSHFRRFIGGQATNLAINMANLGNNAALAACVGYDGLGQYCQQQLSLGGVQTLFIQTTREAPTTVAIITRQTQTPDFVIHRGADAFLRSSNQLENAVANSRIIHTSAFALSREPARTTILSALAQAKANNRTVTLDPNFHTDIWPDKPDMVAVLKEAFSYVDITKPSLEDCARLFGPRNTPQEYAELFLNWGASVVLISMGEQGVLLAEQQTGIIHIKGTSNLEVKDVTGAGDAYWAGFLSAYLRNIPLIKAAAVGQAIAEIKISHFGPLTQFPTWEELENYAENITHSLITNKDGDKMDLKGGDRYTQTQTQ